MRAFDRPRSGIETVVAALPLTAPFCPALPEAFRLSHANGVPTPTPPGTLFPPHPCLIPPLEVPPLSSLPLHPPHAADAITAAAG